jgi:ATP adenylyltransferase
MPQDFAARQPLLEPGTLWQKAVEASSHALACGALQPIATSYEFIEQQGLRFLVRTLPHLARKDQAPPPKTTDKNFNPFLPYDPDLFVADLSPTHVCLLNKFNVVPQHLLIVTRTFEDQETPLTLPDFEALWLGLTEIEGLAFYNSGPQAGASQHHRHLQLVPLPLAPEGPKIPIAPALGAVRFYREIGTTPDLPFIHALVRLTFDQATSLADAAEALQEHYQRLLRAVGLCPAGDVIGAYNLLVTRDWMLIVPRTQAVFQTIPVNSLGFAGTFLIRHQDQLQCLKDLGPLTVLQQVAVAQARS